jgi:hypothetical protein
MDTSGFVILQSGCPVTWLTVYFLKKTYIRNGLTEFIRGLILCILDDYAEHAHSLLRFALASVVLFHGITKITASGPYNMMVGKMGIPAAVFWSVTLVEVAGGAGILLGGMTNDLITRLAGLAIAPTMIGAIVIVHAKNGWSFI